MSDLVKTLCLKYLLALNFVAHVLNLRSFGFITHPLSLYVVVNYKVS
jgi:hypothetical protein